MKESGSFPRWYDWEKITELSLDPDMVRRRRETFASKEECAMCGDFCAVKLLR